MSSRLLDRPAPLLSPRSRASWWDPEIECTLVLAHPHDEPRLWAEYVDGAIRSYHRHGVESALDVECLRSAADTALFFAVIDLDGRLVAGVRAKNPLEDPSDSHALTEWAGRRDAPAVHKMIGNRIPFGVVEMKAAWVNDPRKRSKSLTTALARSGFHVLRKLDVQFLMATASTHVLESWRSSGGVVAEEISPTPYPDDRYQTRMMWWDRSTMIRDADPQQVSKMFREAPVLSASDEKSAYGPPRRVSGIV